MFKVCKILKIKEWEHLYLLMCLRKQQVSYLFKNITQKCVFDGGYLYITQNITYYFKRN